MRRCCIFAAAIFLFFTVSCTVLPLVFALEEKREGVALNKKALLLSRLLSALLIDTR